MVGTSVFASLGAWSSLSWERTVHVQLTPHQRPHRVDQVYRLRFHACAVLRAAAEGGLVLRCVAPADCVALLAMLSRWS